jgi:hypothetical protein
MINKANWSLKIDYANRQAIAASAASFTAPSDGIFTCNLDAGTAAGRNVYVNGKDLTISGNDAANEGPLVLPINKGDVITGGAMASWLGKAFVPIYIYIYI